MKSRSLGHAEKENRSLFLEGLGLDNAGLVVVVLAHPQRRVAVQKSRLRLQDQAGGLEEPRSEKGK